MMLSDMGAEVLRIDRAGCGERADPSDPHWDIMQRGRRSVALDLKHPDAVATALRMIERADALIEGFRPGVMERLGLGPDVCLARNPRLVYGRMTGWGQEGPMAHAAGPRHQLHRARRDRSRRSAARARARRRRSTWSATSAAAACCSRSASRARSSSASRRQGPGGRRGDGRRRRDPDGDDPRHAPARDLEGGARVEPDRHRRALLRHVRDRRRQVRLDRRDRAAVLRGADREDRLAGESCRARASAISGPR
jgi:hypothetical protein